MPWNDLTDDPDYCATTNEPHVPDWSSIIVSQEHGVAYLIVVCKHCGRPGGVRLDNAGIEW